MTDATAMNAVPHGPSGLLIFYVQQRDGIVGVARNAVPLVQLDGAPFPAVWGRNEVTLAAGSHHLTASVRRGNKVYGGAETTVAVSPGRRSDLYYAPPAWLTAHGRFGTAAQPMPGAGCLILLVGGLVVVVVACLIALLVTLLS